MSPSRNLQRCQRKLLSYFLGRRMVWDEKFSTSDSCTKVYLVLCQFFYLSVIISWMVKAATRQTKEGNRRL